MVNAKVELVHKIACQVGEGPHWDAASNTLLYVDVFGSKVFRFNPETRENKVIGVTETTVGAVIPRKTGGLILAEGKGFAHLDEETGKIGSICKVPYKDMDCNFQMNDAKCDSQGRLWAGMIVGMKATGPVDDAGELYCMDTKGVVTTKDTGFTLVNGLSWSPDDKTMYYTDSWKGEVYAYDFEASTGNITNRRVLVKFDKATEGLPDGHAIDSDGNLWIAMFFGGGIVKVDGKTGEKLQKIAIADGVRKITSCQFGGPNLDELYVTSARNDNIKEGEDDGSGSLFKITGLGVKGLPAHDYAG